MPQNEDYHIKLILAPISLLSFNRTSAQNQQLSGREDEKNETLGGLEQGEIWAKNTAKGSVLSSFSKWEEFESLSKWRKGGKKEGNIVSKNSHSTVTNLNAVSSFSNLESLHYR